MARKPKRLKLTQKEERLLRHPPTEQTWYCVRKECETYNPGSTEVCFACGSKRTKKAKLLWPEYVAACNKVGIEPGFRWKINETGEPVMRQKGGSWRLVPTGTEPT